MVSILALLLATLLRVSAQPAIETNAQTATLSLEKLAGGGNVASRAMANSVNDPTAPVTLVQFRDVLAPTVPGYDNPANILQVEPVFPLFPTRYTPFEQLVKLTLPFPTTPGPGSQTGIGDIGLLDIATFHEPWGKWGVGPVMVFPSASSAALGQGKWQAGPAVALIYTGFKEITLGMVAQNPISFAGDADRQDVNTLSLSPTFTYNLSDGWFAGFSDFEWTFDWKDGGAATIPLGVQVGKVFRLGKIPVSLSLEGAWVAVRPDDTPEWLVCLEFTVIYKTFREKH